MLTFLKLWLWGGGHWQRRLTEDADNSLLVVSEGIAPKDCEVCKSQALSTLDICAQFHSNPSNSCKSAVPKSRNVNPRGKTKGVNTSIKCLPKFSLQSTKLVGSEDLSEG